ncbi:hypothetical protein [Stratiformator vulcanicus]|uniref:Uncharacterized protein n=1 Tax=Stratiformator vulcanicus TaxID=2527980 RepID=A0A517R6Y9_9PLAN|nr:hypothetical protein [Stratiformator vulcanicus]QDT39667.1 hypothetical protein Pan189_40760 [Stratiformator vulcanicus]
MSSIGDRFASVVSVLIVLLPVLHQFGLLDPWLAWEMHASSPRVAMAIVKTNLSFETVRGLLDIETIRRDVDSFHVFPVRVTDSAIDIAAYRASRVSFGILLDADQRIRQRGDCYTLVACQSPHSFLVLGKGGKIEQYELDQLQRAFRLNVLPRRFDLNGRYRVVDEATIRLIDDE